jgi:branched-subunit amino acid transport protein
MDQKTILMTIIGMLAVTYVPRAVPLLALASRSLSPTLVKWLGFIPAAVLAALLAPSLVLGEQGLFISMSNEFLLASVPTFLVALRTRSFVGCIVTGMGVVALCRLL